MKTRTSLILCAVAVLALLAVQTAHAVDATWNGTVDTQWSDVNNWAGPPASVPGTGNTATFNNAGNGNVILDLGGGVTIKTILFNTASAAAYTIGSGAVGSQTLTLNASGAVTMNNTVANDQLFNAAIVLGTGNGDQAYTFTNNDTGSSLTFAGGISSATTGTKTLTVNTNTGNTTLSGAMTNGSGTLKLTKTGAGTLVLSGANTFTGGITVQRDGILRPGPAGSRRVGPGPRPQTAVV